MGFRGEPVPPGIAKGAAVSRKVYRRRSLAVLLRASRSQLSNNGALAKLDVEVLNLTTRQVSPLPASDGLWSPRWSPDGRYIAALSTDTQTLLLFDFRSQKWTELAKADFGYPVWSHDSKYVYFDTLGKDAAFCR